MPQRQTMRLACVLLVFALGCETALGTSDAGTSTPGSDAGRPLSNDAGTPFDAGDRPDGFVPADDAGPPLGSDAGAPPTGEHLTAAHCPGSGGHPTGTGLFMGGGGTEGLVGITVDGATWTDETSPSRGPMEPGHTRNLIRGVGYGGGVFVAVGGYDNAYIVTTCDGVNWRRDVLSTNVDGTIPAGNDFFLEEVAFANGVFVAAGGAGARFVSTDYGLTWTNRGDWIDGHLRGLTAGNGRFVAVGHLWASPDAVVVTSTNGTDWTPEVTSPGELWNIAFGNGRFVAIGPSRCARSDDGASWTDCGVNPVAGFTSINFVDGRFYLQLSNGTWTSSSDAVSWDATQDEWTPWSMAEGDGLIVMTRDNQRGYGTRFGDWTILRMPSFTELTFGQVLYAP